MANPDACKSFRDSLKVPPSKMNKSTNSNTKSNSNSNSSGGHGQKGGQGRTRGGNTR